MIISIIPSIYYKNKTMVEKICLNCNNHFTVINSRKDKAKYCSKRCANIQLLGEKNTICTECGVAFHIKESRKRRYKRTQGYFCSTKCVADFRKKAYIGINNPNFRNAETGNGYLLDRLPKFGRIKLHHKVCFEYLNINKLPNGYCIHHRDCQINNNDPENLALITCSDHRWLHKNFGNATLWAYLNNKISINELCDWCKNPERAMKLLQLNIKLQINETYEIS